MGVGRVLRQVKDAGDTAGRVLRDKFHRFADDLGEAFGNFGRKTRGNDSIDTPGTSSSRPDAPGGQPRGEDGRFLPNNDVPIDSRYDRPSGWRAGMRDRTWDEASVDGVVTDPVTGEVMDPNQPWVMGHAPGYEFRHHQRSAQERGITREQFLDEYYGDGNRFRPETPSTSSRGDHELDWEDYIGPGSPFI